MQLVTAYIDGLNLYYGLRDRGWRRYYWLDVRRLIENLLKPGQMLGDVHYFTTRAFSGAGKIARQNAYCDALETLPGLSVHYGYYVTRNRRCPNCDTVHQVPEEKMTDVNIAVKLLCDAHDDAFDTAILVSGDGDLAGPIKATIERFPEKSVVVAFPPNRRSVGLSSAATASFVIGRKRISDSQLPDEIAKPDGYILRRPERWR